MPLVSDNKTKSDISLTIHLPNSTKSTNSAPVSPSNKKRSFIFSPQHLLKNNHSDKENSSMLRKASSRSTTSIPSLKEESSMSMSYDDYEIGAQIGSGSSAVVYVAKYKLTKKTVAIKVIDLDMFERNQIDGLRKEIQIMSLCKHPNLLTVYGSFVCDSKLYIVTPLLSAGSCLNIMKYAYPDGFEEVVIATILKQALLGLEYLHKTGLIHRDVKAGNLLMAEDGLVQLADFGVSSTLMETGERKGLRKTFVGTPCWMAPEVMEQSGYDYKADIWSFGITALEMATGRAPFAKYPPIKVLMLTIENEPPTLDRDQCRHKYSRSFKEMIDLCLNKDPSKRPSAEKLLQHQFFKQAKKKSYLASTILHNVPSIQMRPMKKVVHTEVQNEGISWDFGNDDDDKKEEDKRIDQKFANSSSSSSIANASSSSSILNESLPLSPIQEIRLDKTNNHLNNNTNQQNIVNDHQQIINNSNNSNLNHNNNANAIPSSTIENTTTNPTTNTTTTTTTTTNNNHMSNGYNYQTCPLTHSNTERISTHSISFNDGTSTSMAPTSSYSQKFNSMPRNASNISESSFSSLPRKGRFIIDTMDNVTHCESPNSINGYSVTSTNTSMKNPIHHSTSNIYENSTKLMNSSGSLGRHMGMLEKGGNFGSENMIVEKRSRFELSTSHPINPSEQKQSRFIISESNSQGIMEGRRSRVIEVTSEPTSRQSSNGSLSSSNNSINSNSYTNLIPSELEAITMKNINRKVELLMQNSEKQNKLLENLMIGVEKNKAASLVVKEESLIVSLANSLVEKVNGLVKDLDDLKHENELLKTALDKTNQINDQLHQKLSNLQSENDILNKIVESKNTNV